MRFEELRWDGKSTAFAVSGKERVAGNFKADRDSGSASRLRGVRLMRDRNNGPFHLLEGGEHNTCLGHKGSPRCAILSILSVDKLG